MVSPYYEASYISIHRQSKGFPRVSSLLLRPSRALGFTEPSGIQVLTSRSTSVITALHSTPFSPDTHSNSPIDHNLDIPIENLLPPLVYAPVHHVPSPRPSTPHPVLAPLPEETVGINYKNFLGLFAPPLCSGVIDKHPHQYSVIYKHGEKIWVPQEELINTDVGAGGCYVKPWRLTRSSSVSIMLC